LASQSFVLLFRELEHEILRETVEVALYGTIELACLDAVKGSEIGIENNSSVPDGENQRSGVGQ
jgi:hypothetical protein